MNALRLGMIQMNSKAKDRDHNVDTAVQYIEDAASRGAELVVLPEFFNTEYFAQYWDYSYFAYAEPDDGYTITTIRDTAQRLNVHIAATIYESLAPGLYYDTLFMIDPSGLIKGRYRKTHPAGVKSVEKLFYRSGNEFPVWDVNGIQVSGIICYDHVFPEAARCAMVNGAELIIGPFATQGLSAWDAMMSARAFENGVYMAPCNKVGTEDTWTFSGASMVVDPYGRILHRASETNNEVFTVDIEQSEIYEARIQHPFIRDRRPEAYLTLTQTYETTRNLSV